MDSQGRNTDGRLSRFAGTGDDFVMNDLVVGDRFSGRVTWVMWCLVVRMSLLSRGRRVANDPARIPAPSSMVDQMERLTADPREA